MKEDLEIVKLGIEEIVIVILGSLLRADNYKKKDDLIMLGTGCPGTA